MAEVPEGQDGGQVRRRRNRRRPRVVVQMTTPTTPPGGGGNGRGAGRARRRRARRQRVREELRKCRGVDTPDTGIQSSSPGVSLGADIPGLPVTNGMTTAGEAWAMKAMHPNGEEATGVTGIPDHVSVPVVTPEFRTNTVITSIGTSSTKTDDVDVMVLPFADLPAIYRRYESGTSPGPDTKWVPLWNATLTVIDKLRDQAGAQAGGTPGAKQYTYPVFQSNLDTVYGYGRVTHKGVTMHLDAPALADQGRIVAGQMALPFLAEQSEISISAWTDRSGSPGTPRFLIDAFSLDSVPLSEDCLVQASPGAAAWEARQGVYMPLRFRDPVHNFSPSGESTMLSISNSNGIKLGVQSNTNISGPEGTTGNIKAYLTGRMLLNCQTGVVLLRGISPTANVHVKVITGLESLVETCSAIAPYQRMSPALDVEAINYVTRMGQELPQALPASYNDMGGLFGLIKNVTHQIRNKFLRKIPGIGKVFDLQEEYIYKPFGLASPTPSMMPTATGYRDPLNKVYERMLQRRNGGYGGLYA